MSADFLYQHVTGNTYTRDDIVRIFGGGEITVTKAGPLQAELSDYGDTATSARPSCCTAASASPRRQAIARSGRSA